MKVFGIPLTDDHDNCFGICISEIGEFLGKHTSSNYSFLKSDLESKCNGHEYIFLDKPTDFEFMVIIDLLCSYQKRISKDL